MYSARTWGIPWSLATASSATPWGPWGLELDLFSPRDAWFSRLLHRPGADQIVQSLIPIYDRDGRQVALPDDDTGVPYGAKVLQATRNADGTVTIDYLLSVWNPYQVFLMSSTFRAPRRP